MKAKNLTVVLLPILLLALAGSMGAGLAQGQSPQEGPLPQGTLSSAFTYQGRLAHDGRPINDFCDFQFSLYATDVAPTPIDMRPVHNVSVTNGLFTVHLDFGPAPFQGEERWLGIAVACPAGSGSFTSLGERQLLTATPYALYALATSWDGLAGVPPGFADGVDDDALYFPGDGLTWVADRTFGLLPSYGLPQTCADGKVTKWESGISRWVCGDDDVGGGEPAWLLTGNTGTQYGLDMLGTADPVSLTLVVDSAPALRLEFTGQAPNVVAGDLVNRVTPGAWGVAIGGGGGPGEPNRVTDKYGTVGGGSHNQAGDDDDLTQDVPWATVGGGRDNVASGGYSTVGGGYHNLAQGNYATIAGGGPSDAGYPNATNNRVTDSYGTIGGGGNNRAGDGDGDVTNTRYATIGGGWGNQASGDDATVAGGYANEASGDEAAVGGGVGNEATGYASTVGGGLDNQATASFATIAGGGRSDVVDPNTANVVSDNYGTIGGGGYNQAGDADGDPTDAAYATVGGGYHNTASGRYATAGGGTYTSAQGEYATVGGGSGNDALAMASTVSGGYDNHATGTSATVGGGTVNWAMASFSTVGGGGGNTASSWYATVGGGFENTAKGEYVTIGGGEGNQVLTTTVAGYSYYADYATISGGRDNSVEGYSGNITEHGIGATIGGGESNSIGEDYATIGGGYDNTADGEASTIAGGEGNTIQGDAFHSTIGGGKNNTAGYFYATVPGGYNNTAQGHGAFAAGTRAKAMYDGAFVWADGTPADFQAQWADQFRVRANGGVRFDVNSNHWVNIYSQSAHSTNVLIDTSTGAYLTTSGVWTNSSDRCAKENLAPVDGQDVLARLAKVPITTWNYKAEDPSIRRMGPTAQDFAEAFGLGSDDKAIGTVDADGVALAGIQGLYEVVQEKNTEMAALQAEVTALRQQNDDLEARLAALERQTGDSLPVVPLGWLLPGGLLVGGVVAGQRRLSRGGR
jgi:hypothetical protein